MKKLFLFLLLAISQTGFAQDAKRCEGSEPTYINRMPGFYISDCKNSDYNEVEFVYWLNGEAKKINKGGKYYHVWYSKIEGETKKFSSAQINQNYFNAITKIKGSVLNTKKSMFSASINGKEVYMEVNTAENSTDAGSYNIEVVEVEAMQQEIAVNLDEAIDRDGKAALYGILFDTGKSDIKPESAEALKQITDYLNAKPTVKIIVVGHTDNTGTYAGNITLSKARAESIKNYLINTAKISVSRLLSEGAGQYCPVSTNSTEEGRRLNRRVEIVKQ
ncbi:MAG: OmpA family protein [Prolixibacteraceae bacterium]|nr:OmpA family protein [Prolixibacteraceae bacterium]